MDRIQCALAVLWVKVPHRLAHHEGEFDFIVQLGTLRAQDGTLAGEENGGRGLEEEEGLLGLGVIELGNVIAGDGNVR